MNVLAFLSWPFSRQVMANYLLCVACFVLSLVYYVYDMAAAFAFGFINFQRDFANKIQLSSSSCLLDSQFEFECESESE